MQHWIIIHTSTWPDLGANLFEHWHFSKVFISLSCSLPTSSDGRDMKNKAALKGSKSLHMMFSAANRQIHLWLAGVLPGIEVTHAGITGTTGATLSLRKGQNLPDECQQKRRNPSRNYKNIHFMQRPHTDTSYHQLLLGWWGLVLSF